MDDLFIDTQMEFMKRHEEKFLLRQLGATYSFIGKKYDISANRVMQILRKRERVAIVINNRCDNKFVILEEARRLLPNPFILCDDNKSTFNDQ